MGRLLLAAHGTRSAAGLATIEALADAVRTARPRLRVDLCYLDVLLPDLATALDGDRTPTVIVPALLSTGYHVTQDVPDAVRGRPDVRVARHLGPHPLLTVALADRLAAVTDPDAVGPVALVGSGSSRPGAREEIAVAAADLAAHIARPVRALTMTDDLRHGLAGAAAVLPYLLAEGFFAEAVRSAATEVGVSAVGRVLGAHPAIVELVGRRYDEAGPVDSALVPHGTAR